MPRAIDDFTGLDTTTLGQPNDFGWQATTKGTTLTGYRRGDVTLASPGDVQRYNMIRSANPAVRLTNAQVASAFVYQTPSLHKRIFGADITAAASAKSQYIARNVQAILRVNPNLQANPDALVKIAGEPYLAERLRGMAKARDYLDLRFAASRLSLLPEEHQRLAWDNLDDAKKDAYRAVGYVAPQGVMHVKQGGLGIGSIGHALNYAKGLGPLGFGIDDLAKPVEYGLHDVFAGLSAAGNAVGTTYRVGVTARQIQDDPNYHNDSWWSKYVHAAGDAWHGESYVRAGNRTAALDAVDGNQNILDLLQRYSGGDTLDDIVGQYADPGTTKYGQNYESAKALLEDPRSQKALTILERGKVSFGRDLARGLFHPTSRSTDVVTTAPGLVESVVSGMGDAAFDWYTDPTLLAGKAAEANRLTKWGLDLKGATDWGMKADRMFGAAKGTTLGHAVDEMRHGAELAHPGTTKYWADLAKLDVNDAQRAMVAVTDHVNASIVHDDIEAMGRLGKALPQSRNIASTFHDYMLASIERDPLGKATGHIGPDDLVDFYKDAAGQDALFGGMWSSRHTGRQVMPTLSKLGSRKVLAKLALGDSTDWAVGGVAKLKPGHTFEATDHISSDVVASELQMVLEDSGRLAGADAMQVLKDHFDQAGLDAETVTRRMNRYAVTSAGVDLRAGEQPAEAMLRAITTAPDPEAAATLRGHWAQAIATTSGTDPAVAGEMVDSLVSSYHSALGLGDGVVEPIIDRTLHLNDAIADAAGTATPVEYAFAKNNYMSHLRTAGVDADILSGADAHFDRLVDQYRELHAADVTNLASTDPDFTSAFRHVVAYPLASAAIAPLRFLESLATKTPARDVISLIDPTSAETFQQLLDFGIRGAKADQYYGQYLLATEAGKRALIRNVYTTLFNRAGVMDDPQAADFVAKWLGHADQHYALDDLVPGVEGLAHHAAILPDSDRARSVAILPYREFLANIKRARLLDYINGYGNKYLGVNSEVATNLNRYWRAITVTRPATGLRLPAEEQIAAIARLGPAYAFRQIGAGNVSQAPEVERRFGGALAGRQAADAIDGMMATEAGTGGTLARLMDKAHVPQGFRNTPHMLGSMLQHAIEHTLGRTLTPDEVHVARLMGTNSQIKEGAALVSDIRHGLVSASKLRDDIVLELDQGGGLTTELQLRPSGKFAEYTSADDLAIPRLSNRYISISHDHAGREAARWLSLYSHPDDSARIATLATEHLGAAAADTNTAVLGNVRVGIANMSGDTRRQMSAWVGAARGEDGFALRLPASDIKALGTQIGNPDLTPVQLAAFFDQLPYRDRQAVMGLAQLGGDIPVGWMSELTAPGGLYAGTTATGEGATGLIPATGTTQAGWDQIIPHIAAQGHAGPGVYILHDGRDAEAAARAGTGGAAPAVRRFRWKDAAPRLLDGNGDTHLSQMVDQHKAVVADTLRAVLPGRSGEYLAHAYANGLTSDQLALVVDDIGGLNDAERRAVLGTVAAANQARPAMPTSTVDAIAKGRAELDQWVDSARSRAALRAALRDTDAAYLDAYGHHVVDHFTTQGFSGITQGPRRAGEQQATVLWNLAGLEQTGTVPYSDSLLARLVQQDATRKQDALRDALSYEGPDALDRIRSLAVENVESRALQNKDLSYLDAMDPAQAGIVKGPAIGQVRTYVPMIPASTLRAITDKVAENPTQFSQDVGGIAGAGADVNRAAAVASTGRPDLSTQLSDLLMRIADNDTADAHLASRITTTDTVAADHIVDQLRGEVANILGAGADEGIHLGYVDMSKADHAGLTGTPVRRQTLTGVTGPTVKSDLRWIDNDTVLNRGVSFATDNPAAVIPNLTNDDRGALRTILDDLRTLPGGPGRSLTDTAAIHDDRTLMLGLRQEIVHQFGDDPGATRLLLDELARPPADRDLDTLRQIVGAHRATVANHLYNIPAAAVPFLFDGAEPTVAGAKVAATAYVHADGIPYQQGLRDLSKKIVARVDEVLRGPDGRVVAGVGTPIADGTYTQAQHLAGRDTGLLPARFIGPQFKDLSQPQRFGPLTAGVDHWMDRVGKMIAVLSRHPMYRQGLMDSLVDALPVYRSMMVGDELTQGAHALVKDLPEAASLLYEAASANGGVLNDTHALELLVERGLYKPADPLGEWVRDNTGRITRYTTRTEPTAKERGLLDWWHAEQAMRDHVLQVSSGRAARGMIPYIVDHTQRSQFAQKVNNVIPFWFAQEQFYKRWALTLVHTPEAFRRMSLMHNAITTTGFTSTNNEYGDETFNYPGAGIASKAIAEAAAVLQLGDGRLPIDPALTGKFSAAAPGFDSFGLGSPGPIASVPISLLRTVFPTIGVPIDQAVMGDNAGRSTWSAIIPAPLHNIYNAFAGNDDTISSSVIGAMQMMESEHPDQVPGPDATPTEVDIYLDRLRHYARVNLLMRGILGFLVPASPHQNFDPHNLSKEYLAELTAGVPIEQASADFLKRHPDATAYTMFATKVPSKAPADPTEATYQALLDHGDYYDRYKAAGPWLLPESAPTDPFDRKAWYEMLAHKVRVRKNDIDFYKGLKFAEAADDYFASEKEKDAALDAAANASDKRQIRQSWKLWSQTYLAGHRVFGELLAGNEGHVTRTNVINEVTAALADHRSPDVAQRIYLQNLIRSYNDYTTQRDQLDTTTRDRNAKKQMQDTFLQWAERYASGDPTAYNFWRRILFPEVAPGRGYAADRPTVTVAALAEG